MANGMVSLGIFAIFLLSAFSARDDQWPALLPVAGLICTFGLAWLCVKPRNNQFFVAATALTLVSIIANLYYFGARLIYFLVLFALGIITLLSGG